MGPPPEFPISRRSVLQAAAVGSAATLAPATASAQDDGLIPDGPTVGLETVAEGLTSPIALATADEERDRLFVADQTGQVYAHEDGDLTTFIDIEDRTVDLEPGFDERGLLGLAFHPGFAENGRLFVRYSAPPREGTPQGWSHTFVLAEFRAEGDAADPDSERTILEVPQPQFNHNAGPMAFGPEGHLYLTVGDGGAQYDAGEGHVEDWYDGNDGGNGQDTSENLLGGVLRIDVDADPAEHPRTDDDAPEAPDGDGGYAIPEDNPLADAEGHRGEYYAWGMRNPWGLTVADGEVIAVDVAQDLVNRVNHVVAGGNYGWNVREGTQCFDADATRNPPDECPAEAPTDVRGGEPLRDPVAEYPQRFAGEPQRTAVIGGRVYGGAVEDLRGDYVFGDWSGSLLVARVPEGWPGSNDPDPDFADRVPEDADSSIDTDRWAGLWPIERLVLDEATDGETTLDRFVIGTGRDREGEVYVLTTAERGPRGESGRVQRIVPAERSDGDGENANEDDEGDGTEEESDADEAADSVPGFGALAALAGVAGGTAAVANRAERDE